MSKIITNSEVEQFKKDGAVLIKGKFDNAWIEKLKKGINQKKLKDWAREERTIMEANGYKNGDNIEGKMFPKLWSLG